MPSLRVLLVRLFPKLLGTTQRSNNGYYVNNSHSHIGGNISVNRPDKSLNSSQADGSDGITYSQTYIVQWGEHDGAKSMQMSDLDIEAMKSSSRVSENEL
jgi:hypothetical protein